MSNLFNVSDIVANNNSASNNKPKTEDRPKSQVWINVGYEVEVANEQGEQEKLFVSLPYGLPIDTMEPAKVNGSDKWAAYQGARNDLLAQIQQLASQMQPGEEKTLNLQVQVRRVKNDTQPEQQNSFGFTLQSL